MCDRKTSSGEFSNEDATIKSWMFHRRWLAMFVGGDISPCNPILRAVTAQIGDEEPIAELVKRAFEIHYQAYLSNLAAARVLGRWKLSMEEFLETGRKKFGADVFDGLVSQIEQVKLQCQFLVCGFEGPSIPHVFTVRNPGYVEDRSIPGYWAIGSGDFAAMSTLGFYKQSVVKSLGATYYNVMAAKFMAEKATHEVGENSYFWQLGNEGSENCDGGIEAYVRGVWEKLGQPRVPAWFVQDLDDTLQGTKSSEELSAKLHAKIESLKDK
jgi:hypothetical protein